ncbi:MAG: cytochrome c, partial [Verrucomicrobiota bacterium]
MAKDETRRIRSGETIYFRTCVACHGSDGRGANVPGTDLYLAPPLVGSARVQGDPEKQIPILINGLIGPIDGKTYQTGFMAPAKSFGIVRDDRLAEVISYIRYAWGQEKPPVSKELVKQLRMKYEKRTVPWTLEELK